MKDSNTLEDQELSNSVLSSMEELIISHVDALINKYDAQLRKNGKRLDAGDFVTLRKAVREKLKIKMTISSCINQKMLDDWNVFLVPLKPVDGETLGYIPDADVTGSDDE